MIDYLPTTSKQIELFKYALIIDKLTDHCN